MKKILAALSIGTLAISSCHEKGPNIIYSVAPKTDTTYVVTTVPAAEPHNVLIENFTGATCSNCPAAHELINTLGTTYPGRINAISLFVNDFPQAVPPTGFHTDFRTVLATNIESSVFQSLLAMPIAGIDRLPVGQAADQRPYQCYRDVWSGIVATQLNVADSINMDLSSTFDATTRKATIKLKVTYVQPVSTPQNFSIAVLEDGFVDIQEFPTGYDSFYHFNDVLRGMVTTGALGDALLPSITTKEAGRVYEATYNYNVDAGWNAANCRLIAFVHRSDASSGTFVYQSKQTKLVP